MAAATLNLYFLATHDLFDMDSMYEYHELKDSLEYGYMFGLFSLRQADWTEIKETLMQSQDNLMTKVDGDCQKEIRGIKVKKNLGSLIESVGNFSMDGYTVKFEHGDICERDADGNGNVRYSSEMRYTCNNMTDDYGWPEYVGNTDKCHFKFQWRSKWACSICRPDQTRNITDSCFSGNRTVAFIEQDRCIIVPEDRNILAFTVQAIPKVNTTEESNLFVNDFYLVQKCAAS